MSKARLLKDSWPLPSTASLRIATVSSSPLQPPATFPFHLPPVCFPSSSLLHLLHFRLYFCRPASFSLPSWKAACAELPARCLAVQAFGFCTKHHQKKAEPSIPFLIRTTVWDLWSLKAGFQETKETWGSCSLPHVQNMQFSNLGEHRRGIPGKTLRKDWDANGWLEGNNSLWLLQTSGDAYCCICPECLWTQVFEKQKMKSAPLKLLANCTRTIVRSGFNPPYPST